MNKHELMTREWPPTALNKRSVVINGHKTSISLEDDFYAGLRAMAGAVALTISDLVTEIDIGKQRKNLSSSIRLAVLAHYRDAPALSLGPAIPFTNE